MKQRFVQTPVTGGQFWRSLLKKERVLSFYTFLNMTENQMDTAPLFNPLLFAGSNKLFK